MTPRSIGRNIQNWPCRQCKKLIKLNKNDNIRQLLCIKWSNTEELFLFSDVGGPREKEDSGTIKEREGKLHGKAKAAKAQVPVMSAKEKGWGYDLKKNWPLYVIFLIPSSSL